MKTILLNSQSLDWESFDCGQPELTRKLVREAELSDAGFQQLYGVYRDEAHPEILGVLTVRAGQLQAPLEDIARVAERTGVTVPTLHVEVLAVRVHAQGKGVGQLLMWTLLDLAHEVRRSVGLHTVSLEATESSVPFYRSLGFEASDEVYGDGTRAMWLVL